MIFPLPEGFFLSSLGDFLKGKFFISGFLASVSDCVYHEGKTLFSMWEKLIVSRNMMSLLCVLDAQSANNPEMLKETDFLLTKLGISKVALSCRKFNCYFGVDSCIISSTLTAECTQSDVCQNPTHIG